ncbi:MULTISPECIES: YqzE family protein [Bacillus]|uniref:YqzE family protein n=2 Tax=Bacillus TaxID=1386 RepID=A0A0M4FJG1_9BACI|nr:MULTISPECIES: YqzE family protein [Bacillus]ALC81604.1 hypothetical protein AM592_08300 [Bacillus gobiensis]MBP1080642.1 hypothetical protein [Bacillus capparidis]MED1094498.1 YqzE family protein [Bacillus capparidis]
MKTNDYVKYMTEQLVKYMDMPENERKEWRQERKSPKPPRSVRWFGMFPIAIKMFFQRNKQ